MHTSSSAFLSALLAISLLTGCLWDSGAGSGSGGDGVPSHSSALALDRLNGVVWVVNPDADSVTAIDTTDLSVIEERRVGREPWSVAVTPEGLVIVANRADGTLTFLEDGRREDLHVGPEPGGLALSSSGRLAYVSLTSSAQLAVVDTRERQVRERIAVADAPGAVGVTDDGDADDLDETVVVAHRLALPLGGEDRTGRLTLIGPDGQRETELPEYEFGFSNGLEGLALKGGRIHVVHLLNNPGLPRQFNTTVSAGLSQVPLLTSEAGRTTSAPHALHLNDSGFSTPVSYPRAVALTGDGSAAYLVLGGSDAVMGVDLTDPAAPVLIGFWAVGSNPRGIVLDRSGERAYVMNYLSRDVSVLDLAGSNRREFARIPVVDETLPEQVVAGKILFNKANDPRISRLGWISCSSCHLDGGGDGTTWFTPEGARQTMPLWNLAGTAPLHAAASRDEVQDFESDIEVFMKGVGLAPGRHQPLLGEPNGGRSQPLDALAAFVLEGFRTPEAPAGGSPELTAGTSSQASAGRSAGSSAGRTAVARGRLLYEQSDCAACHGGPAWTVSSAPAPAGQQAGPGEETVRAVLHDVGTFDPANDVLGENGFDIPTLLGLHATAPYLHDGSAPELVDVLANELHTGVRLADQEKRELALFLSTIDSSTEPFEP